MNDAPARPAASPTAGDAVFLGRELPPAVIVDSLRALFPARLRPAAKRRFTLLDTFDRRVNQAGARLVRNGTNGSTTLAWQPGGGRTRHELHAPHPVHFAWDLPEGALRQAVAPVIGVRRLFAQADVEAHASLLEMLDRRGKIVARVSVESIQARLPGSRSGWRTVPTLVTVTGLRGYEQAFARVLGVIESRPGLEACREGLAGAVRQSLDLGPGPAVAEPGAGLSPSVTASEAARRIHRALLDVIAANEEGVRADFDTEFLHDYRVAVRRTRSLLGQLREVFPPDAVQHFRTEFSWLGRLTGPPRDLDVLALALRDGTDDLATGDHEAVTMLVERGRQRERTALLAGLDSERHDRLLAGWRGFLEQPADGSAPIQNAARPFAEVASDRAWRLYRRISGRAQALDAATAAADVHQLRIGAKKLRYVVDVIPGLDEDHREPILSSLRRLQRVLGDYNDAEVQERRLIECSQVPGATPGALLALGRLAERQRLRARSLRATVAGELARFCAPDLRLAFKRALEDAAVHEDQPCA